MRKAPNRKKIPLVQALTYLVGSTLLITGGTYNGWNYYQHQQNTKRHDLKYKLSTIVQTGPEKQALPTDYLAELMHLSVDRPTSSVHFAVQKAKEQLLKSFVIKAADVRLFKPGELYVDYTIRKPIASLYDYENIALDEDGYLFPISPFFTPKTLPEIYLGITLDEAFWDPKRQRIPLQGQEIALAFDVLKVLSDPSIQDLFKICRIDVSRAFAESYGQREIVLLIEDSLFLRDKEREVAFIFPRLLRLSTKHYPQELANFIKLRAQLLEEEQKELKIAQVGVPLVRQKETIIDFRIPELAFIEKRENAK
jgi:hypothetical protein